MNTSHWAADGDRSAGLERQISITAAVPVEFGSAQD